MIREGRMSETVLRQWELLRAIPRAPRKADVATLVARLEAAGYRITKRSVQRELNLLSSVFPLQSDTRAIPYGWSWAADAPAFDLPAMDGPTALTLRVIEQFIPTLLARDLLAPQFARARAVLDGNPNSTLGRWVSCVRVVPREMPLLAPKVNEEVTKVVYQSLLDGKRIKLGYVTRSSEAEGVREYEVSPLGLVVRGNLIYLVCTLWQYQDVRQLVMHRIKHAQMTEQPLSSPPDFDLDRYVDQGELQYPVGSMIRLKVIFARAVAAHLYETPLSDDQQITDMNGDHVMVTATVRETAQLEWWLLAFGSQIEVVEPDPIRGRIAAATYAAAARYTKALAG